MSEEAKFQNLAIHGEIFLDDVGESVLEIFNDIKELELPPELDSQIVNIDEDNPPNSVLILADRLPEDPVIRQSTVDLIALSFDDNDDISISVDASEGVFDTAIILFDKILSHTEVHITDFDLEYTIDRKFSKLAISIDKPEIFDPKGVKLRYNEYDYIIQSSNPDQWSNAQASTDEGEQTEENTTSVSVYSEEHFNVSESGEFIRQRKQDIEGALESITP